ncbi:hypothetical protein [Archangium lansingense]|uniref:Uncharacterized protein n=1 Tax=Archangium lansingense TaxID=2995310 RepID=A0ABT4APY2_9BACT|nr:hypothetical protein [Archangium lansinium]MCY1083757.1 hypothetical protein [Archangium lansinium]
MDWIARAGVADFDRIVDRFFRAEHETLSDASPRAEAALKRLTAKGYLNARSLVLNGAKAPTTAKPNPRARHHVLRAYSLTARASESLELPPPPRLRESFGEHHLKTLDALDNLERQHRAAGNQVLGFKMETQLMSERFEGKDFRARAARTQEVTSKLPDAQLAIQRPDGSVQQVNVEYVSAKYSNQMIREKATAWTGQPTVWAVPNQATAERVLAVTGQLAVLV